MSNEEAEKVLKELEEVRPEKLNDKAKRLFEAIMEIADERDKAESDLEELIAHTNIIIKEGLDSEDDIQLILKKWKTAYEKEKEKNKELQDRVDYLAKISGLLSTDTIIEEE